MLRSYSVDNEYEQVYNRIKLQEGVMAMLRYCFRVDSRKSDDSMQRRGVGLVLSYSFLG